MARSVDPAPDSPDSPFYGLDEFSDKLEGLSNALDSLTIKLQPILPGEAWPDFPIHPYDRESGTQLGFLVSILEDRISRLDTLTAAVKL